MNQGNATFTASTFSLAGPPATNPRFGNVRTLRARRGRRRRRPSGRRHDASRGRPERDGDPAESDAQQPEPGHRLAHQTGVPAGRVRRPGRRRRRRRDRPVARLRGTRASVRPARVTALQYGAGIPGSAGIVPIIGDVGPFRSGESGEIRIRGGIGGASGYLAIGLGAANTPLFGGSLLVDPLWIFPIQLGGPAGVPGTGGLTIPWVMPASLVGLSLYHQAGFVDAGAAFGVSGTNGLRVDVAPYARTREATTSPSRGRRVPSCSASGTGDRATPARRRSRRPPRSG